MCQRYYTVSSSQTQFLQVQQVCITYLLWGIKIQPQRHAHAWSMSICNDMHMHDPVLGSKINLIIEICRHSSLGKKSRWVGCSPFFHIVGGGGERTCGLKVAYTASGIMSSKGNKQYHFVIGTGFTGWYVNWQGNWEIQNLSCWTVVARCGHLNKLKSERMEAGLWGGGT